MLLSISDPLPSVREPVVMEMFPALPQRLSKIQGSNGSRENTSGRIAAEAKGPSAGGAARSPEIMTESGATMVTLPPWPLVCVVVSSLAPPVISSRGVVMTMEPALPPTRSDQGSIARALLYRPLGRINAAVPRLDLPGPIM